MSSHATDDHSAVSTLATRNHDDDADNNRRVVLPEEEYTSTLSHIIQRDYFPDLQRLKGAAAEPSRPMLPPTITAPPDADGDEITAMGEDDCVLRDQALQRQTLTGFHARATNEDDHEFDTNHKAEIRENRKRLLAIMDGPKAKDDKSQKLRLLLDDNALASDHYLLSAQKKERGSRDEQQSRMLTANGEPTSHSDSGALTVGGAPGIAATATTAKTKASYRNGLFFNPTPLVEQRSVSHHGKGVKLITNDADWDDSSHIQIIPPAAASRNRGDADDNDTRAGDDDEDFMGKSIRPSRTRFPPNFIKGRFRSGDEPSVLFDIDNMSASGTIATNDDSTLTSMPPIVAHRQEASFQMPSVTQKEKHAQSAEVNMTHRTKRAKHAASMQRPKSRSRPSLTQKSNKLVRSLTPAARAMLRRSSAFSQQRSQQRPSSMSRGGSMFASSLRQSYTPNRAPRRESSSRRSDHAHNATPVRDR